MDTVSAGILTCYLDSLVIGPKDEPLFVSFYDRSTQNVRALGADLMINGTLMYANRQYINRKLFDVFYTQIIRGKEKFVHGIAIAKDLRDEYLVTTDPRMDQDLYNFLMQTQNFPLLREWIPEIKRTLLECGLLYVSGKSRMYGNAMQKFKISNTEEVCLKDIRFYASNLTEDRLKAVLKKLLEEKRIQVARNEQKPLAFTNMDEYFQNYGTTIMENLRSQLHPISELNGKIDSIALLSTRPYPQQAAMVNGVYEYFRKKKKGCVLFVMGMGSGKTLQAAAEAEMLYVRRWLEAHPKKTLVDAYERDGVINYRHIVMCPGQLVEKWRDSILKDIPYAKPVIINDFKQLVALREAGKERKFGKEFYIVSKDFAKLSYQMAPIPKREARKRVEVFYCADCNTTLLRKSSECAYCGSTNIAIKKTQYTRIGMVCPHCNRLLYKKNMVFDTEVLGNPENEAGRPLQWFDFAQETNQNESCVYCDEPLWKPFVRNINTEFCAEPKKPTWVRQTFWANHAKKGKKTYWILEGKQLLARDIWGEALNEIESEGGCRKYSPAQFIKKYMKGYFDVFIADEVHKSKGGSTAQGTAFHAIMKSCRYVLALTGSLTGGMASDLFYLMFRMFPEKMRAHNFRYEDLMKFSKEYGCLEQTFAAVQDVHKNVFSRGRQISPLRTLPGISPVIFSEFLLDVAVFLDIKDMSSNMPPLHEKIVLVKPKPESEEEEVHQFYNAALGQLKAAERQGIHTESARQQFSMSYLDKPYGVGPIIDPDSGGVVLTPNDYSHIFAGEDAKLLEKEAALCKTIRQELSEGRNCVLYAEYTLSEETNVLPRLQKFIMQECGLTANEVVVMKASTPVAAKREEWMHIKAEKGMRVMLCNPRLCETGLDFCWFYKGIMYNFPTLMFYQCGYSLFITWQAAGRSWRLNQIEECRTYYFAYEGTVQQAILQVLGEKKSAASAIQGHFSADGLAAMAKGVDTQVRIAQIMSEMDSTSGDRLREMFDVISGSREDDTYDQCERMKLFSEIIRAVEEKPDLINENVELFSTMFSNLLLNPNQDDGGILKLNQLFGSFDFVGGSESMSFLKEPKEKMPKKKRGKKSGFVFESIFELSS